MARKIKYGKLALVICITALIWVWADLAVDERHSVSSATITVAKSIKPNLWVSFDDESSVTLDNVVLKGRASKIADVKRQLNSGTLVFEFFLDPEQEAMTSPGEHTLDILGFLKKSDQIRQLGLTIESCQPETLPVNVVELKKKSLAVKCFDQNQNSIEAVIQPPRVDMFVPGSWAGEKLLANLSLTPAEIDQARLAAIEKTPYIVLPGGQNRQAPATVKIAMPPEESLLADYTITAATLGIALSPTLQGKYKVEIANLDAVMGPISVRATPEAIRAYELQPFPTMTLYILDDDKNKTGQLRREVIYNFPADYVRSKDIELKQPPVEARFKLIPLSSGQGP